VLGLDPQPNQLVVEIPMFRASTFRFVERPNHKSRLQHPFIAQHELPGREKDIWAAMPLCCGLHKGVGCRPRAAEHDVRDVAVPATRDEPIEAVPLLPVEVDPRLQRRLVDERKRCTVCRPHAMLKVILFCNKRGERGALWYY